MLQTVREAMKETRSERFDPDNSDLFFFFFSTGESFQGKFLPIDDGHLDFMFRYRRFLNRRSFAFMDDVSRAGALLCKKKNKKKI